MKVEYSEAARDELFETIEYYEAQREGLGLRFLEHIEGAVTQAASAPFIGAALSVVDGETVRLIRSAVFPYKLPYVVREDVPADSRGRSPPPQTGLLARATPRSFIEGGVTAMAQAPKGICTKCDGEYTRAGMSRHLVRCRGEGSALHLHVRAAHGPWWLDVAVPRSATLKELDSFLRAVWLECCGHMSAFTVGVARFEPTAHDYGWGAPAQTMSAQVRAVMGPGTTFEYEYDFGSTTELKGRVVREGIGHGRGIELLARNVELDWACEVCDSGVGRALCPYCGTAACSNCSEEACPGCDESFEEMGLPIVNSPRMGVCGYVGPQIE